MAAKKKKDETKPRPGTIVNGKMVPPPPPPLREYDKKTFEGLCFVHCTNAEITHIFRTDLRTLDKWCKRTYGEGYYECYKKFSDGGKASLRRIQINLAKKNAAMAIWMGKQWLGQRDIPQELEQFNGKLAVLLDKLAHIKLKEIDDATTPAEQEAD